MRTLFIILYALQNVSYKTSRMFPITDTLIPDIYILFKSMILFFLTFKNTKFKTVNLQIEIYEKVTQVTDLNDETSQNYVDYVIFLAN